MDDSDNTGADKPSSAAPAAKHVAGPNAVRGIRSLKILKPLQNRDFAFLWSGMTVSLFGDGIYLVAIAWLVLRISNSPTALGAVGVAWTIPQIVSLLWGGVASDRFDRRKVMILADVTRGIPIAIIGILSLAGTIELWHVFVLVAIYGIGEGVFMPAFSSVVPDVVPRDQLIEANSLDQFVRPLALRFAGPALGGLIIAAVGVGTAFVIDAATFAFSALMIMSMRKASQEREIERSDSSTWRDVREGLSYVRGHAWLWITLLMTAVGLLVFYGPFHVLMPFLVKNSLGGDARALGVVFAVGGVGAVLSALFMSHVGLPRRHLTFVYVSSALGVLMLAAYGLSERLWHVALASFAMEVALTAGLIVWTTLVQIKVPGSLLGRVSSLDWIVSTSLIPLSYGLAGPLSESIGIRSTFLLTGTAGAIIVLAPLLSRRLRDAEREPLPALS
ncbi:MAG: MFS transporter [Actinomycetota bacterium]|nr:MFS transporter [Actinomycetota bacterium]